MSQGLHAVARHLQSQGRHGDTELVHMHPAELRYLENLAGQSATANPVTGLPEAFSLWKAIVGGALSVAGAVIPGAQFLLPAGISMAASSFTDPSKTTTADQAKADAVKQNQDIAQRMVKIPAMETVPAPYAPKQGSPGVIAEQPQPMQSRWNGQLITPGQGYYAEGGPVDPSAPIDPSASPQAATAPQEPQVDPQQRVVLMAIAALKGKLPPATAKAAIQAFIEMFGEAEFADMKKEVTGIQPAGAEGMLKTDTSGMEDDIPATIGGQEPARLSGGEYVVPADVVSDLGDGNGEAGAKHLDGMLGRVRTVKHGTTKQPKRIDPAKVMPA